MLLSAAFMMSEGKLLLRVDHVLQGLPTSEQLVAHDRASARLSDDRSPGDPGAVWRLRARNVALIC